jgi:hypothetical protein
MDRIFTVDLRSKCRRLSSETNRKSPRHNGRHGFFPEDRAAVLLLLLQSVPS